MTDDKIRKNLFIDKREALGFSALRLWPLFRLVFRFLHLKCACFSNLGISGGISVYWFEFCLIATLI